MKRKTTILLAIIFSATALYGAYVSITGLVENGWPATAAFVVIAAFFFWHATAKGKKQKRDKSISSAEKPTPIRQEVPEKPEEKPQYFTAYNGRVNGVTFQGRQRILARLKKKQEEFENICFELEAGEYQGEPSIKVMAGLWEDENLEQIGFIPAASVDKVLPYVGCATVTGEIYGGLEDEFDGSPKSYGCAVEVSVKIEK